VGKLKRLTTVAALGCTAVCVARIVRRLGTRRSLRGKVVLITGASRGLGLALAEQFGKEGALVCMAARDPRELEKAIGLLTERGAISGHQFLAIPADLRDSGACAALIQRVLDHFGKLDILVNNAGIIAVGPVEDQTIEDFRSVMETNFFAGLQCCLAALPYMSGSGQGAIVNIASIGGKLALPHLLPYTASKFAMVGFSEGLHAELRIKKVHVLTVCPGLMRTGSHLHASFSGDAAGEYRWFSLLASLPGISVDAQSAARRIVAALRASKTEITITAPAVLARLAAALFPSSTAQVSSLFNRRLLPLPAAEAPAQGEEGQRVRTHETTIAGTIGMRAAHRYNQVS